MPEVVISLQNIDEERALLGHLDRNLRFLRLSYGVEATSRGGKLTLTGTPEGLDSAARKIDHALRIIRENSGTPMEVAELFHSDGDEVEEGGDQLPLKCPASPRSPNQAKYMKAIAEHAVTFGLGPAGTGKSYLAVALALALIKRGDFRKVVLVRPAVEAGESLGFLPGDLEAKVNPYLRPLYDALEELTPRGVFKRYLDEGVVEISPLAYMRGRTLSHAVIILDEAQNTTSAQMKMFLTRMGEDSKVIVTGDMTQVDLPRGTQSGLLHATRVLRQVKGLAFCHLTAVDIVRHPVVRDIVKSYNSYEEHLRQSEARDGDNSAKGGRSGHGGGGSSRRKRTDNS